MNEPTHPLLIELGRMEAIPPPTNPPLDAIQQAWLEGWTAAQQPDAGPVQAAWLASKARKVYQGGTMTYSTIHRLNRLVRKKVQIRHTEDVAKIKRVLARAGYEASNQDIQYAWERYSDQRCAGWLFMRSDPNEIVEAILEFLEPDNQ